MANEAPYKIVKQGGKYAVVNNAGTTKAIFKNEAAARNYQRALYANVPGAATKADKTKWSGKAKAPKEAAAAPLTMADGRSYPISGQSSANSAWKLRRHHKTYSEAQVRAHISRAVAKLGLKHPGRAETAASLLTEVRERQTERSQHLDPDDNDRSALPRAVALELGGKLVVLGNVETTTEPAAELAQVYETAREANPHHLWLQGRFVQAEHANSNGAFWTVEDLQLGQPSVKHGPMNWLHDPQRVVGTLVESKLVAPNLEAAGSNLGARVGTHLAVAGVMWKHLYPRLAEQVEQASVDKRLSFSMECTSDAVTCTTGEGREGCGKAFPFRQVALQPSTVCEHLRERSSLRRFVDPVFLGGALIVPPVTPAWKDADASVMEAATKEAERTWSQGEAAGHTQQSWAQLVLAAASVAAV